MGIEPKQAKQKAVAGHSFLEWGAMILKMPPVERIEMVRDGVKVTHLVKASQYYGISQAKFSKLLGISDSTITRKIRSGSKLGPLESERLARIALIEAEAGKIFESSDLAKRWMLEPNLALGESPLSLLDTDVGADEVRKVLASIAYGGVA